MSTDLEAQQAAEAASVAFSIQRQIIDAMEHGRRALWMLAEALYEFDEAQGWKALGYENLSQWLAEPEITITRGSYYRYVRVWRKLVVERKIDANRVKLLDQAKVAIVVDKIATAEVTVDDAFADVESLPARDLREKYYGKKEVITTVDVSNVGQDNAATNGTDDSGHVLPDMDEPVRADELMEEVDYFPEQPEGVQDDGTPIDSPTELEVAVTEASVEVVATEVVVGEVVEDYPAWITPAIVRELRDQTREAWNNGASFPKISRRCAQTALALAEAWLATHQS